tara:strand:- start:4058 stop:4249 length:192 start_codon:yes stop_codon:yes gene_type:complete
MISVTFYLKGRQKTFTASSHSTCYNQFKKDYGEVENEVSQVEIVYHDGQSTLCELSHYKKNYC